MEAATATLSRGPVMHKSHDYVLPDPSNRRVSAATSTSGTKRGSQYSHKESLPRGDSQGSTSLAPLSSCQKNPGHKKFFPVNYFNLDNLPKAFQRHELMEIIRLKAHETVHVIVRFTSSDRPPDLGFNEYSITKKPRFGSATAFVYNMEKEQPCPIPNCRITDKHMVSGYFKVMTACHVVFNDQEAQSTTFSFFYDDDDDKSHVVEAHGVRVSTRDVENNRTVVECVTHDLGLCKKLMSFRQRREVLVRQFYSRSGPSKSGEEKMVVLISHPHGMAKRITIGDVLELDKDDKAVKVDNLNGTGSVDVASCQLTYTAQTCPGSGGGSVNVFNLRNGCIAFAPHCSCGDKKEGVSGLGWTLY